MNDVLDACAMIAYLRNEAGGAVVDARLLDPSVTSYAHSLNLCEVYYDFLRNSGLSDAEKAMTALAAVGVVERADMDPTFWRRVGTHKARGHISLADCVCLALAERLGGTLITSDHNEFDPIVRLGICSILFIR